jgi:2-C-methyl-D-erythritol 2,4-cyclodiphosphate synthase
MRIGTGYDVHQLTEGRKLILGGVEVPFDLGLSGHSDADVLTHAIMDALLGAAGLRDIGVQFPPDDPQYKDISSLVLLKKVRNLLSKKVVDIINIDAVIIAEQPKLSPFIDDIRRNLSRTLGIYLEQVMVKATTTDGLGFTGKGEGIAVYAVALIEEK